MSAKNSYLAGWKLQRLYPYDGMLKSGKRCRERIKKGGKKELCTIAMMSRVKDSLFQSREKMSEQHRKWQKVRKQPSRQCEIGAKRQKGGSKYRQVSLGK